MTASSPVLRKGGGAMMSVFEALSLMLAFGMFVIALLAFNQKK